MKRILVSTPAQAKLLRAVMDDDWQIDVYMGRVIDLPPHALGIDVLHDFRPTYGATQPRIVNRLRKALQAAEAIYVATTPTLDAEAHAWRLLRLAHVPATTPVMRVTLHAMTEAGIRDAFAQPRPLDMRRVEAAETLRTLERLVGYLLTPLARPSLGADISIGYVSSMALQQLAAQPPAIPTRWGLRAQFETRAGERVEAELITREGRRVTLDTPAKAAQMTGLLRTAACWVAETAERTVARAAAPLSLAQLITLAPFVPAQTMALATALYERGRITCPLVDDAIVPTDEDGALTGAAKVLFDRIAAQAAPDTETVRGARIRAWWERDQSVWLTFRARDRDTPLPALTDLEALHFIDAQAFPLGIPAPLTEAALALALHGTGVADLPTCIEAVAAVVKQGDAETHEDGLHLSARGQQVSAWLTAHTGDLFADTHALRVDRIAAGETTRLEVLHPFWARLQSVLATVPRPPRPLLLHPAEV